MFEALGDAIEWIIKAPFIICGWLIIGFIAGATARYIMRVEDKPFINDIGLGLMGAIIGGILAVWLGIDTSGDGNIAEWLITLTIAIVGSMVLIFIGRLITGDNKRRKRRRR